MTFSSWLAALKSGPSRRPIRRSQPPSPRRKTVGKLAVEDLEGRIVPAFVLPAADHTVGSYPIAPISGDFNGDGISDLAVANNNDSTVSVLLGNGSGGVGDGTFQDAVTSGTGTYPLGSYPHSIAAGYFDSDTNLDLVTANYYGLSVMLGNGDGSFQSPTNIDLGSGWQPESVAVGDFNGD